MSTAPKSKPGTKPATVSENSSTPRSNSNLVLDAIPSAEEFAAAAVRRSRRTAVLAAIISVICGLFTVLGFDTLVLPLVFLLCLAAPLIFWHYTRATLYTVLAAACLFELFQTPYTDALTDRVPFFWNVNTIFQVYGHVNFKAVPLNLFEVILLLTGISSLVKAVVMHRVHLKGGPLLIPICLYIGFVTMGWINGMATGGDFKLSLQETRAQFYFLTAYLMAYHLVTERKHANNLLWITVLCVGLKGILYTFRRYVTLGGLELPDQGVGSHEEAFLFNTFEVLLVTLILCGTHKRLLPWLYILLPVVVTGNLATNRRAATAAMAIAIPVMLLALYKALPRPKQRRAVAITGIVIAVSFSIYYPLFKNSESMFAQPARAIRSQFQPDERDASSNAYRDAENMDQMATIRLAPIQGYGYGKRFLHAVPIADISGEYEWWDLLPHNQILWVWMRVGTIGFWVFWMMISSILIYLSAILRVTKDAELKTIGIFTMLTTVMLMLFGLLDLQISNFRDMLFTGFWIGTTCALARLTGDEKRIQQIQMGQMEPGEAKD